MTDNGEPLVLSTALRHGVNAADMLHALRNPVATFVMNEGMAMWIGPATDGQLIEVGVIEWHGEIAIAHAMSPARRRFLEGR